MRRLLKEHKAQKRSDCFGEAKGRREEMGGEVRGGEEVGERRRQADCTQGAWSEGKVNRGPPGGCRQRASNLEIV